jgi:hypothetical protein
MNVVNAALGQSIPFRLPRTAYRVASIKSPHQHPYPWLLNVRNIQFLSFLPANSPSWGTRLFSFASIAGQRTSVVSSNFHRHLVNQPRLNRHRKGNAAPLSLRTICRTTSRTHLIRPSPSLILSLTPVSRLTRLTRVPTPLTRARHAFPLVPHNQHCRSRVQVRTDRPSRNRGWHRIGRG